MKHVDALRTLPVFRGELVIVGAYDLQDASDARFEGLSGILIEKLNGRQSVGSHPRVDGPGNYAYFDERQSQCRQSMMILRR